MRSKSFIVPMAVLGGALCWGAEETALRPELFLLKPGHSVTSAVQGPPAVLPGLRGPYIGQKPPGMKPELFAPGIVSKEGDQGRLFVAPDGSEIIYWERTPGGAMAILSIRSEGGTWSSPVALPFSREHVHNEPCLSLDGQRLFFVSDRPRSGAGEAERRPSIWVSEKSQGEWAEPRRIAAFDGLDLTVQPYAIADGGLYFMGQSEGQRAVYYSRYSEGRFSAPAKVGESVFTGQASGPCLSPDGRVLILHSRREGGFGGWDLYVSFIDRDGNWGELRNLGETINTAGNEAGASFSPDGRYLFFSRDGDVYWVSARILETGAFSADVPGSRRDIIRRAALPVPRERQETFDLIVADFLTRFSY